MNLTRRGFLKTSALTGVTAIGLLGCEDAVTDTIVEDTTPIGNLADGIWMPAGCTGCTSWCTAEAYVVNGRVLKVRGNEKSLTNKNNACVRMHLGIQQMYDPDRIKQPMKRTNPVKGKGVDPKWVPISWEEAMDKIADEHLKLINSGETHKFAFFRGRYTQMNSINYGSMVGLLGSPNNISHSSICAEAEKFGPMYTEGFWNYRDYDIENTDYIIAWGMDPLCSNRQVASMNARWGNVLENGTKIAVVEPRLTATANKAHEWLPVKSGEDGAVAIAMAHVILAEGLWSREFVGDFVDGVNKFVVGQTVAEDSFKETYTSGIVKWWNLELKDKTPEWAQGRSGVSAAQIRRVATEFGSAPKALVMMGGGGVMQIRGGYNSMAISALNGLVGAVENEGGTTQDRVGAPNAGVPSRADFALKVPEGKGQKIDQRGYLKFPAMNGGNPGTGVVTNNAAEGILNEDPYDIKMVYGYWCNFNYSCPGTDRWDRAMAKVPFFVHHVVHEVEMSQFADILLPSTHANFEQWGTLWQKQNLHRHAWLARRLDNPVAEAKNPETEYVWMLGEALAKKGWTNLLDWCKTFKDPETGAEPTNGLEFELYAVKIRTEPIWNPDKYVRGEKLNGWQDYVNKGVWSSGTYPWRVAWGDENAGNFNTATKRYEFYSETLKGALQKHADKHKVTIDEVLVANDYGDVSGEKAFVPHYQTPIIPGDANQYPLVFVDAKSRLNREGRSANCSWYQEFRDVDFAVDKWGDTVIVNPVDAAKLGISEGDDARITSPTGSITGFKVKVWEGIVPGMAVKHYGQGHWSFGKNATNVGGNNNDIMPAVYERLSGSTVFYASTRVKVEKA